MLQFQYKEFSLLFAGIVILVLLFLALLRWKKKVRQRAGDPGLITNLTRSFSPSKFNLKFIIVCVALALGIFAVMNPRIPGGSEMNSRTGIDVAIALDVSKSMLATDLQPSRLERAKQFIGKLLTAMPDDRIALVLFAGKAYLQMPLTSDHSAARMFVSAATPESVPQQGTVISDALTMSANVFDNEDRRFKSVILISDGEDHDEKAIATAKDLTEQGMMINTVGVGSPAGSTIPDPVTGLPKTDESGVTVISKLNELTLQEIASETHGIYLTLNSSDEAVSAIKYQLSQIESKAFTDLSQVSFTSYYWWIAAAMFLLLFLEIFITERKKVLA